MADICHPVGVFHDGAADPESRHYASTTMTVSAKTPNTDRFAFALRSRCVIAGFGIGGPSQLRPTVEIVGRSFSSWYSWSENKTLAGRAATPSGASGGDLVAETLQALDVIAGLAADMHALFVVVGAEILVAHVRLGEQGVDAGEHRVAGGDQGFLLGHALG
jgi:hypothetical protein